VVSFQPLGALVVDDARINRRNARQRLLSVFLALAVGVGGCIRTGPVDDLGDQGMLLRDVDQAWAGGRYAPAYRSLVAAVGNSADYELRWRMSRLAVSMGLSAEEPGVALEHFVDGRGDAWACLEGSPSFSQLRRGEGWAVAVGTVDRERVRCLTWGAIAWTRWIEVAGPRGAAMDIAAIKAFYDRAEELGADSSDIDWGRAVLDGVAAAEPDSEIRAALRSAVEDDPGELCRVADWVFLGLLPAGKVQLALETAAEATTFEADSPESRNAQKRLLRWREGALKSTR